MSLGAHVPGWVWHGCCANIGAARLTQVELAGRALLSVRMIRNLERGHTRHPHGESVRLLARALGLDDAAREAYVPSPHWGMPVDTVAILPPTGLVGREELVAEVIATFEAAPCLITLCGLPGEGKTSVAAAVSRRLRERGYEVWWASCRTSPSAVHRPAEAAGNALPVAAAG